MDLGVFAALALIVVVSALAVVASPNPIHSALALVVHLLGIAGFFATLDAHFLAAVQIIVYAGAIVVLVLFVLMLLNIKEEPGRRLAVLPFSLAAVTAAGLLVAVIPVVGKLWPGLDAAQAPVAGTVEAIGRVLYRDYVVPFEVASILIMVAIVGSVMIARRRPVEDVPSAPATGRGE